MIGFTFLIMLLSLVFLLMGENGYWYEYHWKLMYYPGSEGGASNALIFFGFIVLSGSILMASINTKD